MRTRTINYHVNPVEAKFTKIKFAAVNEHTQFRFRFKSWFLYSELEIRYLREHILIKRSQFQAHQGFIFRDSKTETEFLYPYWQILENSSRNIFKISVLWVVIQTDIFRNFNFGCMSLTDFRKTHPQICYRYLYCIGYTVYVKYRGTSQTDFWKICSYLDEFSRNRSSSYPEFGQN